MDGASLGALTLEKCLLDLFGTGYTRILLVHLSFTATIRWNIKATCAVQSTMVCGIRVRTGGWSARFADAIPSQGHKQKRKRTWAALVTTSGKLVGMHTKS